MKIVDLSKISFQGDVAFLKGANIPKEAKPVKDNIVAHSETGHHHIAEATAGVEVFAMPNGMELYVRALGKNVDVVHKRSFDTHETLRFLTEPGDVIKIQRQREYTPEGWRRVED